MGEETQFICWSISEAGVAFCPAIVNADSHREAAEYYFLQNRLIEARKIYVHEPDRGMLFVTGKFNGHVRAFLSTTG